MSFKKIAIDGPAGVGKTTVGRSLARFLSFLFIESGKLYRGMAYAEVKDLPLKDLTITEEKEGSLIIKIGDISLPEEELYTENIGETASRLATKGNIRKLVTERVREFAKNNNVVVEGRDIGTEVLPSADLKIFLTASPRTRAERRWKQSNRKGNLEKVLKSIKKRDKRDTDREIAPLKPAADAIIIDTTDINREETVQKAIELAEKELKS